MDILVNRKTHTVEVLLVFYIVKAGNGYSVIWNFETLNAVLSKALKALNLFG